MRAQPRVYKEKRTHGLFTVEKVTEITFTKMNGLVCIYVTEFYTKNAQKWNATGTQVSFQA